MLSSGDVVNPQSWNHYAYTYNNPVNMVDIAGLWTWGDGVNDDFKKQFRGWIKDIEKARDSFKQGSKEYDRLNSVLKAYGSDPDALAKGAKPDGPAIRLSETRADGSTPVKGAEAFSEFKDGKIQSQSVTFNPKALGGVDAFTVAHEGTHLADDRAIEASFPARGGLPGFNPTTYDYESRGYETEQIMARGLNVNHETLIFDSAGIGNTLYLYNKSWAKLDEQVLRSNLKAARDQIVKQDYNVTEKDPGPRAFGPKKK